MEEGLKSGGRRLPQELVEQIVVRIPFPQIFKVASLSKEWKRKFSPVASLDNEEEEKRARCFQKQVSEQSSKWESFCPTLFGRHFSIVLQENFSDCTKLAYKLMPFLSFIPEKHLNSSKVEVEGPLMLLCNLSRRVYVANILTKTWRKLPRCPIRDGLMASGCKKMIIMGDFYKVIIFTREQEDGDKSFGDFAHIYCSKSHAWISTKLSVSKPLNLRSSPVHLNGIVYVVAHEGPKYLLAFNIEERTVKEFYLHPSWRCLSDPYIGLTMRNLMRVQLLICNSNMVITACYRTQSVHPELRIHRLCVLTVDLRGRGLDLAAKSPLGLPIPDRIDMNLRPISNGYGVLFFKTWGNRIMACNITKGGQWKPFGDFSQWSHSLRLNSFWQHSGFSFQPGSSPFLEV